jgi:hypothetical protein
MLAAVFVLPLLLIALPAAPLPKEVRHPSVYFPTKVGATWVYQWTDDEGLDHEDESLVTAVEFRAGVAVVSEGFTDNDGSHALKKYAVSGKGLSLVWEQGTEVEPANCLLNYPLVNGASWKQTIRVGADEYTATRTAHWPEPVDVPAGTYAAIRVEWETPYADGTKYRQTEWYAPDVGLVKLMSPSRVVVLKSFTPGKD